METKIIVFDNTIHNDRAGGSSMRLTSMWKKIRQRLKTRRKLYLATQVGSLIVVIFISSGLMLPNYTQASEHFTMADIEELSSWLQQNEEIETILHRKYVCGDEIEHFGALSYEEIAILGEQHVNWKLTVNQTYTLISFVEEINDLSPYCKKNAFFGMNGTGEFSLFDGEPERDQVIKTFFQLNVPYLESSIPKEELKHLLSGIRVHDIEEYDSVLSTFSEFSMERTKAGDSPSDNTQESK